MDRPLISENAVAWRKYAESLEAELAEYRPQNLEMTFRGIPVFADRLVPEGEVHVRYHDVTVAKIANINMDFAEACAHADWKRLSPIITLLDSAVRKIRRTIGREPDEVRVSPRVRYEPHKPGEFPRRVGETLEQYHVRYDVFQAKQREMMQNQMDDAEEFSGT